MKRIYQYEANGNLESIEGTDTPWYDQNFQYDSINRLTDAEGFTGLLNTMALKIH